MRVVTRGSVVTTACEGSAKGIYDWLVLFCSRILDRRNERGPKKSGHPCTKETIIFLRIGTREFQDIDTYLFKRNRVGFFFRGLFGYPGRLCEPLAPPSVFV